MTKQRIDQDRRAYERRQNPKGQRRQFPPQRQVWPVVHIEGCNHQDVGRGHPGHVNAQPRRPKFSPRRPADRRGDKRQKPQNEQVIVLAPSGERQRGHRDENDRKGPVIDRSGFGMTARPLSAQHRNRTGYDRCQSGRYVHGDKRQKEGSIRREGKTSDISRIPNHCLQLKRRLGSGREAKVLFRFHGFSRPLSGD
jgi:hypothetical protein